MDKPLTRSADDDVPQFYPIRNHTRREIECILAHCGVMCADYERHYDEVLDHMRTYIKAKDTVGDYPMTVQLGKPEPLSLQELEMRITVGIGAGFFILSPRVALYFLTIDPVLYIDQVDSLLRNTHAALWGPSCAISSLLTALLVAFSAELAGKDCQAYLTELVKNLPIRSKAYTDQLTENASAMLTTRFDRRTLH